MAQFISLLRGINVSGKRKILMADLKALYQNLGFKDVATYIQSGNVVFHTNLKSTSKIESLIKKAIDEKYGFDVPVLVKTVSDLVEAKNANPFLKEEGIDTKRIFFTFLSDLPEVERIAFAKEKDFSPDVFIINGKNVFGHCPNGFAKSKLTNNFFESKLKVRATTRNVKTVNKLIELAGGQ